MPKQEGKPPVDGLLNYHNHSRIFLTFLSIGKTSYVTQEKAE